jgi:3-dehydroquinate synthase
MKILEVKAESKLSKILIGEKLANLNQYIGNRKAIIITDSNLLKHYKSFFPFGVPVIEIGLGEKNKTLKTLELIFDKLLELETDRSTFIVAIGGGIVCDVAGFAASAFMRGLPFGFVSTTLLSQVDASVGGKNGVNFRGFKNMIGVFSQPDFVICDTELFKTLDRKEFISGFSEIIKAGAIKDLQLFDYCEKHAVEALSMNHEVLEKMVHDSVLVKAKVVEADEREKGERRLLNFGHTFAHAIEKKTGILHGEAVSM